MAYNFMKLGEAPLLDNATDPNLLIEVDGEVQRIPANNISVPQVQSDWNEDDPTNVAYILNKPTSLNNTPIVYTFSNGYLWNGETEVLIDEIIEHWDNGKRLKIQTFYDMSTRDSFESDIIAIYKPNSSATGIYGYNWIYYLTSDGTIHTTGVHK